MADLTLTERLQPSLLDRLTDDDPSRTSEPRETRAIDVRRLREIVRRDLSWLLNTTNLESEHDMEQWRQVATSTVNYGVPEVTGKAATPARAAELRLLIRRAIERFEPRILPGTLEIELREQREGQGAIISFDIRGELWAQPVPLELYLRTALDVTTGELTIERQG